MWLVKKKHIIQYEKIVLINIRHLYLLTVNLHILISSKHNIIYVSIQ